MKKNVFFRALPKLPKPFRASALLKITTMPINIRRRKSNTLLQLDWCGTDARDGCGQEWKGNFLRCGSRAQHLIFVIQFSFMFFCQYVYFYENAKVLQYLLASYFQFPKIIF